MKRPAQLERKTAKGKKPASVPALAVTGARLPALDMAKLDAGTRAAIGELLAEGESANTRRSYQSAARYWIAWWELRYEDHFDAEEHLPMAPEVLLQFIADHAQRLAGDDKVLRHELPAAVDRQLVAAGVKRGPGPLALATLEHRLAALARLHRSRGLESPTDHQDVRRLLRATRSAYARRGQLSRGKDPLTVDRLDRLLDTCDRSPVGVRDRALLLFAFASGGRRRAEVAGADLSLLRAEGEGYSYELVFSKTNQTGEDRPENHKPIMGDAALAMRAWLALLSASGVNVKEGPIFRRIRRGGRIQQQGLTEDGIWQIVKARCLRAGLEGDFSPHSLRAGFMTEAGREGVPLNEAMDFSGHRDVKTALGYMRKGEMKRSAAADLVSRRRAGRDR